MSAVPAGLAWLLRDGGPPTCELGAHFANRCSAMSEWSRHCARQPHGDPSVSTHFDLTGKTWRGDHHAEPVHLSLVGRPVPGWAAAQLDAMRGR